MNINNIALVRATNVMPLDGIVKSISNSSYLKKDSGLEFSYKMCDLLKELGVIPPDDPTKMYDPDYYDESVALTSKILKEYMPYVSDYNSMVLFSINGICPDDNEHGFANNTFSDKRIGIIEPLSEHIDKVISLVPTDTAIKGNVELSKDAIVLVDEKLYELLNEEEKTVLHNNIFTIKTFNGSLKEAITKELANSNRYTPETLSLSASTGGVMPSETSETLKECLNNIAKTYGLSQMKYFNLLTSRDKTIPKYEEVCNEYDNAYAVLAYYMKIFLHELLSHYNAPDYMINRIDKKFNYGPFILEVINIIKEHGIEDYKVFLDRYNKALEVQKANGSLMTPEEIVNENQQSLQK